MMFVMLAATVSSRALKIAAAVVGSCGLVPGAAFAAEPVKPRISTIGLDGSALPGGIVGLDGAEATVWFAAAQRSAVGEIDVASKTVGYIALGHGAKPRSLTRCPNGNLYVMDPALNVIHEVTPSTEEVKRHPMPAGQNADLISAVCTAGDVVMFTGYNGWVGKLEAATGKVSLVEAHGGRGPAQITIAPSGSVWFASYASNHVVRIDPVTLKQDAFAMPAGVEGPKGIAVDGTGRVWVSAFRSARVARFDPRRRTWDAWALGEGARPHAVTIDVKGAVLVTDVGHDKLLRFDAATGSSETVAALSERGQARAMTRLGEQVWISEAAADRVLMIDFASPPSN